ncbi:MAG: hypothetical protein WC707_04545 [Candidatus Babeliaceae bacterium]|jgi:hypothetical protein
MKKIVLTGLLATLLAPAITKPVANSTWASIFFGATAVASFTLAHSFDQKTQETKKQGFNVLKDKKTISSAQSEPEIRAAISDKLAKTMEGQTDNNLKNSKQSFGKARNHNYRSNMLTVIGVASAIGCLCSAYHTWTK